MVIVEESALYNCASCGNPATHVIKAGGVDAIVLQTMHLCLKCLIQLGAGIDKISFTQIIFGPAAIVKNDKELQETYKKMKEE